MMQLHQAAAEEKADARTVLMGGSLGRLVVSLEDVGHQLVGNADARVAYPCEQPAAVGRDVGKGSQSGGVLALDGLHRERDLASGGCIFERIRKQVEEHLLVFVRIDPDEVIRRTYVHGQFDVLFFESVLEHLDNRFDEVRHPIGLDVEFQHVGFEFLEVKQLVHQAQHAARVAADDVMGMSFAFGQTMVVDEAKCA